MTIFVTSDEKHAIVELVNIAETYGILDKLSIKSKKRVLRMRDVFSGDYLLNKDRVKELDKQP